MGSLKVKKNFGLYPKKSKIDHRLNESRIQPTLSLSKGIQPTLSLSKGI